MVFDSTYFKRACAKKCVPQYPVRLKANDLYCVTNCSTGFYPTIVNEVCTEPQTDIYGHKQRINCTLEPMILDSTGVLYCGET